jgi:hypothetical protein
MGSNVSIVRMLWRIILILVAIVAHMCIIPAFVAVIFPFATVSIIFNPLTVLLWAPMCAIPYILGWMLLLWLW